MRGFLVLFIILFLVGCNTTKKVSSHTDTHTGNVMDSTSVMALSVDSTAWSAASGSTTSTSTQYAVVTDADGKPIFDDDGRPITFVSRRDTVTKIVNVEHFTTSSIVVHDTLHVFHRDTLALTQDVKTTVKSNSNGWWGVVWRLIALLILLVVFKTYIYKR